jgi:8-oxo-dGTP pyrophosphatase MutT (NUDIX family)
MKTNFKTKQSAGLVIIYNGMILLGHTTGRGWYGSYGIPKGGIEDGEDKMSAAIRETLEEVGVKVSRNLIDSTEHIFLVTSDAHKINKTVYYYVVKINELSQIGLSDIKIPKNQLQVEEIDWAGFLSYKEATKRIMKSQLPLLNNMLSKGLLESNILNYEQFTRQDKL